MLLATFELPFPPSINKYWRRCGAQYFISKAGQAFRKNAIAIIFQVAGRKPIPLECNLSVEVDLYPPDRRKRDVDNTIKPTLDSLAHAGVMVNDVQVKRLTVEMFEHEKPGRMVVRVCKHGT